MTDFADFPAKPPATRREKERLAHRNAILDAAERIVADRGFAGATIADIARAAEFAVGSIYNFFPGKRELAEAVMLRIATERVQEVLDLALPVAEDPDRALPTLAGFWVRHHAAHGAFLRMGIDHHRRMAKKGRMEPPKVFRDLAGQYRAACEAFFEKGLRRGFYRPLPAADLVLAYEGVCHECLFAWERGGREGGVEALERRTLSILTELLRK